MDAYLLEEQHCQISFRSDLKQQSFWRRLPQQEQKEEEQDE